MRLKPIIYGGTLALAVMMGVLLIPQIHAGPKLASKTPSFVVDPFWPKPLPNGWVTGEIGGTCVDSKDHVFIVTRGFQTGGLTSPEGVGGVPLSKASPPIIEFDPDGNVVNAWGDPSKVASGTNAGLNAVLPNGTHGCYIDYQDNFWMAGQGSDGIVQKYSHDGKALLLQIGTKFLCDRPDLPGGTGPCANGTPPQTGNSQTLLNLPADIAVDPNPDPVTGKVGSVYIADGYGNHRVVVFDPDGKYLRQFGSVGTGDGQFTAGDGGHPHCVVLGKDGLIYACDRGQDRVNVFRRDGTFVMAIPIVPGTAALGTSGSAWDVDFSPDKAQTWMYESDGGNEIMWIMDHAAALAGSPYALLDGFGRPGHNAGDFTFLHMMAIDSKGNLYAGETVGGRRIQKFTLQKPGCKDVSADKGKGGC